MLTLSAKIREETGKKIKNLRKKGIIPAVLYGPKIKTASSLGVDLKEFGKVYQEIGESALISLEIEGKKFPVLIHEVQKDPVTGMPIHVDFYQPSLEEEVTVGVPIIFEGTSPAVKELGGTLVKSVSELEVKALPQNLPHEIKINVSQLKTFEDHIKISDLKLPTGVRISKEFDSVLAFIAPPEKVEEELVKPVEEKVEEVKIVEEKKVEEEKEEEEEVGK